MRLTIIKTLVILLLLLLVVSGSYESLPGDMGMSNLSALFNKKAVDDFAPSTTLSGRILVFNGKSARGDNQDIFLMRNIKGFWDRPVPLEELNTTSNEETPFISRDGSTILFASDRPGGTDPTVTSRGRRLKTYDIYISQNINGLWSNPKPIAGDVNTSRNERSPSLSADGKTLFFSRWPHNDFPRARLYMATLKDGEFTDVKKIGTPIHDNSLEIGMVPALEKNKFYFSSMRYGGYGGWDIYSTSFINGKFTKPINLGRGINTAGDELYYSQNKGYSILTSNRSGLNRNFSLYVNKPLTRGNKIIKKSQWGFKGETKLRIEAINFLTGKTMEGCDFSIRLFSKSGFLRGTKRISNKQGEFIIRPKSDVAEIEIEPMGLREDLSPMRLKVSKGRYEEIMLRFSKKNCPLP